MRYFGATGRDRFPPSEARLLKMRTRWIVSDRLDWNDITFNAIGAALGVVILLHLATAQARPLRHSRRTILTILTPIVVIALVAAPPVFTPFYSVTPVGLRSHELTASEGLILVGTLWIAVHELVRHLSRRVAPARSVDPAVATIL